MKRFLQWLLHPAVWLYVKRLEADSKAETERAELWRRKAVAAADLHLILSERIAALELALTNAADAADLRAETERADHAMGIAPHRKVVLGADGIYRLHP